ncbi:MAG: methionine--tRNA ligase [Deltaproteobacteria bacterium]|nr:methionine--tRNA ligase [Deltaproteobacteria bacterium]
MDSANRPGYYVTTPIYYVNDVPHLGTAYTTIAADVFARFQRLRGRQVHFLTGLDEHGQKIAEAAEAAGLEPKAFVDRMAAPFREAWAALDATPDDFIRTTEDRHQRVVQGLWSRIATTGDIYKGMYEDWYCTGCEAYYTEKDLIGGKCPVHERPATKMRTESYFFRLSAYQERLLQFYAAHPDFVLPASRMNEVVRFVESGLRDLSISRANFRWGIPVPGDDDHVMYVWFDALANYVSALGGEDAADYRTFWPADVHLVGKDILRFHAVYWPAFLIAAGLPAPRHVFAHGWLTINGQKMSKSLRNVVEPRRLAGCYGVDAVRYYLMRDVNFGLDGDFSHAALVGRINADLANDLGNLLNRTIALVEKLAGGVVPPAGEPGERERALREAAERTAKLAAEELDAFRPHRALEAIWALCGEGNRFVDAAAPWALAKAGKTAELHAVLYAALEALRWIALMTLPVMPGKARVALSRIGDVEPPAWPAAWGGLRSGVKVVRGDPLFPRIDADREKELALMLGIDAGAPETAVGQPRAEARGSDSGTAAGVAGPAEPSVAPAQEPNRTLLGGTAAESLRGQGAAATQRVEGLVPYDHFAKLELRIARVLAAEKVPKADKLIRLSIDAGDGEPRTIVAGIAARYQPEQLVGKRIVVLANLEPRKLRGIESRGMLLAATHDGKPCVLTVEDEIPPGTRVS